MDFMYNGTMFPLNTSLRVAYELQGVHKHKPYMEIFEQISDMPLDRQIQFIYIAFNLANANVATETEFLNYCLDHIGIQQLLETATELMQEIMFFGLPDDVKEAKKAEALEITKKIQAQALKVAK